MGIEWDKVEITAFLSFTWDQWTPPCVDGGCAPGNREEGRRGMCDRRARVGAWMPRVEV
jgi:hypothetical protein